MKALTLRQPHAWLVTEGWRQALPLPVGTDHRGAILLVADTLVDPRGYDWCRRTWPGRPPPPDPSLITRGGIVGRADLVACVERPDLRRGGGTWLWMFATPERLPFRRLTAVGGLGAVADVPEAAWAEAAGRRGTP